MCCMKRGDRLLRLEEVLYIVGVSSSTLYDMINRFGFPRPVRVCRRVSGWWEHEVYAWLHSRPRGTDSNWE